MLIASPLDAVAVSLAAKAAALDLPRTSPAARRRLIESMAMDIRKYTDAEPHAASAAAQAWASTLAVPVDLRTKTWHDQPRFDPGRRNIIAEHKVPVRGLVTSCVELGNPEDIRDLLRRKAAVVWITRAEDDRLNGLGFRTRRPDPDAAYAAAGITILGD